MKIQLKHSSDKLCDYVVILCSTYLKRSSSWGIKIF